MRITLLVGYQTRKGPVFIGQSTDGRFHPIWKDESLGSYHSLIGAVESISMGHVFSPSDGTDLAAMEIPSDPQYWLPAGELM